MKHLDYKRNSTEGAASSWQVRWDRHYDQKLTLCKPYTWLQSRRRNWRKSPHPIQRDQYEQHLKKCHEDFEATPMLFRAVSDNLKNLVFLAKTRSPGLWLTSVTVFTFSLHSWQCLEHRCKNGRNALLIFKIFPECSSLHKTHHKDDQDQGEAERNVFSFLPVNVRQDLQSIVQIIYIYYFFGRLIIQLGTGGKRTLPSSIRPYSNPNQPYWPVAAM